MKRTTLEDIRGKMDYFNNYYLKGKKVNIKLGRRYGHKYIDVYDNQGKLKKTIASGLTSGEVIDFIDGMMKGIQLIG